MLDKIPKESETNLSPLDQIRLSEAEVARRVASAREAAGQKIAKARAEAARIKTSSRERGEMNGQAIYREVLSKAEEDAEGMVTQARSQADKLRQRGKQHMQAAVEHTLQILLEAEESSDLS